jgi:APA family basic amino acid/polyamine antiporter
MSSSPCYFGIRVCLFVCLFVAGTTTTLTATTLCSLYGQPRIFFRMARDGLLFERFGVVNAKGVPTFGVWVTCAGASVLSALFDLGSLAEMISIGTLLAFSTICLGVLVLRYGAGQDETTNDGGGAGGASGGASGAGTGTFRNGKLGYCCLLAFVLAQIGANVLVLYGDATTLSYLMLYYFVLVAVVAVVVLWWFVPPLRYVAKFKCPWVPLVPCLGIVVNTNLILALPTGALVRLVVWTVVGFAMWFAYGAGHSKLEQK